MWYFATVSLAVSVTVTVYYVHTVPLLYDHPVPLLRCDCTVTDHTESFIYLTSHATCATRTHG
jgi:hypothetical protein